MAATKTNINNGRGGILNPDKKNEDGTFATDGKVPYNAEWEAKAADENKNHDPGPEGPGAILTGKEIPGNGDGQPCPDTPQQADADWPQSQEPG